MRTNAQMSEFLRAVEIRVREEDMPDQFRAVVEAGWTLEEEARLLRALYSGYSGVGRAEFDDVVHFEAVVNGRGMMDYDLPDAGSERLGPLLRRSLGYACTALLSVPSDGLWPVLGYISLSEGGLNDDMLTAHVTFCSQRPDLPPYVPDVESHKQGALMEISERDAADLLKR
ncbi:hypothetical protein [Streptomyces sp. RG80]|uniref:hypothetical protein n=1 Tax=Streptomyces sp. RG80 TaxID=3157340 RepID=UPI00338F777D